ncbi:MAG TPA: uracil-DNA glycosylase family protein [bacterium]
MSNAEDRQGHPFVGPAGRLPDKTLEGIEFDRRDVYVTNAVKQHSPRSPAPAAQRSRTRIACRGIQVARQWRPRIPPSGNCRRER